MTFNELIKKSGFRYKDVTNATGIPVSTIDNWRRAYPKTDDALKVLAMLGYSGIPDSALEYLLERYNMLPKDKKKKVFDLSGVSYNTFIEWKLGRKSSFFLYKSVLYAIDDILGSSSFLAELPEELF